MRGCGVYVCAIWRQGRDSKQGCRRRKSRTRRRTRTNCDLHSRVDFDGDSGFAAYKRLGFVAQLESFSSRQSMEPEYLASSGGDELGCHYHENWKWALSSGLRAGLPDRKSVVRDSLQCGAWEFHAENSFRDRCLCEPKRYSE